VADAGAARLRMVVAPAEADGNTIGASTHVARTRQLASETAAEGEILPAWMPLTTKSPPTGPITPSSSATNQTRCSRTLGGMSASSPGRSGAAGPSGGSGGCGAGIRSASASQAAPGSQGSPSAMRNRAPCPISPAPSARRTASTGIGPRLVPSSRT